MDKLVWMSHRGEGVSRERIGDVLEHGAEGRAPCGRERGAGAGDGGQRGGLVLGGDGGEDGGLAPADGAAGELDPHGDVGDGLEARGGDGEGRGERHVERARLGRRHVHGEGLLEGVEAERLHRLLRRRRGRRRRRRDGAEAGAAGGLANEAWGGLEGAWPRAGRFLGEAQRG